MLTTHAAWFDGGLGWLREVKVENRFVQIRQRRSESHTCHSLHKMSSTSPPEMPTYEPKPSLKYAAKVGLQAGVVGTFVSTIQNALASHSHGAAGFMTRTGGTIGLFGTFFVGPFQVCLLI